MRIPSLKTIQKNLEYLDEEQCKKVRAILEGKIPLDSFKSVQELNAECYHRPDPYYQKLTALNEVMEGHGIEVIFNAKNEVMAEYINVGDTYIATVMFSRAHTNPWVISDEAGYRETQERAYKVRFA